MGNLRYLASGGLSGLPLDPQLPGGSLPSAGSDGGGRTYSPPPGMDYYTYGSRPEVSFFKGELPKAPIKGYSNGLPNVHSPEQPGGGTNWANVLTGIPQLGKTVALAGDVAQGLGYDNALTQGMVKYGNEAAHPLKTALDWYKGTGSGGAAAGSAAPIAGEGALASLGSIGAGGMFGTSGAAALGASAPTAGLAGLDTATAGSLFGTSGSAAVGSGVGSLGGAGLGGATEGALGSTGVVSGGTGATSAGAGAGAGLLGSGAAMGGLGLGIVAAAAPFLHGNYDNEIENRAAYEKAFPGIDSSHYGRSRGNMLGRVTLPNGAQLDSGEYDNLTNAWYNANFEKDAAKKADGQKYLEDFNRRLTTGEGFRYVGTKNPWTGQTWTPGHARGGYLGPALTSEFRGGGDQYVKGPGTGRSDEIPAKLSDGEYVMDAETVAMLGDGSSEAGSRKLDELRSNLRKHKGKKLAKGKFSDNAKDPAAYMRKAK